MSLSTYLFFNGNCAEAFEFYRSALGGEFIVHSTFADAPPDMKVADADKEKIMHVSLAVGDSVLMGSDMAEGFGRKVEPGTNFAISHSPKTKADVDRIFPRLTEGGNVTMPLQETFWGAYFGQGTDRFGVQWMLNVELNSG